VGDLVVAVPGRARLAVCRFQEDRLRWQRFLCSSFTRIKKISQGEIVGSAPNRWAALAR
jgi:hypothetical protein